MAIADKKDVTVTLAGEKYVVKAVPLAKVRMLKSIVLGIVAEVTVDQIKKADTEEIKSAFDMIVDRLLEIPYKGIKIFIPTVPEEIFLDEENGVTFPELDDAFRTILEVNRLDKLKDFFTKAALQLLAAQTKKR